MMRPIAIGLIFLSLLMLLLIMAGIARAADSAKTAADQWEQSLHAKKAQGTLPGPKPGQKCLWSRKLHACLWYTPRDWSQP